MNLEDIENFVLEAGSDDLATFGGFFEGGIHCQQIPDEIAPCIHAILESGQMINSYLEIGVAAGGTTYLIDHFFHPKTIILIDDNKHHKAGLRPQILSKVDYQVLIGRSQEENIISKAHETSPYDLIMIDGDHLYVGVKIDVDAYLPMLSLGGLLALHDSAIPEWGVGRMVRELKQDEDFEFIDEYVSKKHKPCGIALFRRVK